MFTDDINAIAGMKRFTRNKIAESLDTTAQNLGQKLNKGSLKDTEAKQILDVLGTDVLLTYVDRSTGNVLFRSKL